MEPSRSGFSPFSALRRVARSLLSNRLLSWQHANITVSYRVGLEGGGTFLAEHYLQAIRKHCSHLPVESAYEWCAGPGFIGFSLLAEAVCEHLCLSDINPAAVNCVRRTVARNNLQNRVSYYLSDNLKSIPAKEQFDLVVGNPPSYYGLNPLHPYYSRYKDDLRPNDAGWHIHRGFFERVGSHLKPGAHLFVKEVAVHSAEVRTPQFSEPYDIRPRPPLQVFQKMMERAGLTLLAVEPMTVAPGGFPIDLLVIRNR